MKFMNGFDAVMDRIERWICVILLIVLTTAIILQIVLRIFNVPLSWTEELARLMFVWCVYIGSCHAARFDKHLKVDILAIFMNEKGKYILNMISGIITIVFFCILTYIMVVVLKAFTVRPQTSPIMKFDMIYAYSAPFVCAVISSIRYLENLVRYTKDYMDFRKSSKEVV